MRTRTPAFIASFLLLPIAQAQVTNVDITLVDNQAGQYEVRVRPDGAFDGVVTAVTFSLRWPVAYNDPIDTVNRLFPMLDYLTVSAAAPIYEHNGYYYRIFNGFGLSMMSDFDQAWVAGQEYPVLTIDMLDPLAPIELIDTTFSQSLITEYYCSLGGSDRTGTLFDSPEPTVNIHSSDNGAGQLSVMLNPEADFFGWVSDLTFTLRWATNSGVELGSASQEPQVAEYLNIQAEGQPVVVGDFTYQRFHGTGVKSIANSADGWAEAGDVAVLTIPFSGGTEAPMVVVDDWTGNNDSDYEILLNGETRTGSVEDFSTSAGSLASAASLLVTAWPNEGGIDVRMRLSTDAAPLRVTIHDNQGRPVWTRTENGAAGDRLWTCAGRSLASGVYLVEVRHGNERVFLRTVR